MAGGTEVDELKALPSSSAHRSSFILQGGRPSSGHRRISESGEVTLRCNATRSAGVEELASLLTDAVSGYYHERGIHCSAGEAWVRFFGDCDVDGSGRISFDELETAIRKRLRSGISRYQLLVLWRQLDSDNSGEVSVEEVVQFLYRVDLSSWPEAEVQSVKRAVRRLHKAGAMWHQAAGNWYKIFLQIDFQSRGFITLDDLKRAVRGGFYGFRLSAQDLPDDQLHQLWKAMDDQGDMRVPLRKFLAFMRRMDSPASQLKKRTRQVSEGVDWDVPELSMEQMLLAAKELARGMARLRRAPTSLNTPEVWTHLFQMIDSDGSGRMSFAEFEDCARKMEVSEHVQELGIKALWCLVDADRSGQATERDFVLALYRLQLDSWQSLERPELQKAMEKLNAAADKWHRAGGNWFKVLSICDEDGSGRLDFEEFAKVVRKGYPGLNLGQSVADSELRGLWKAMDSDRSGEVSIQEFMVFARRHAPAKPEEQAPKQVLAAQLREEEQLFVIRTLETALQCYFSRRGLHCRNGWETFFQDCGADRCGRLSLEKFAQGLRQRLLPLPGIESQEDTARPVVRGVSLEELNTIWSLFQHKGLVSAKDWALGTYRLELQSWPEVVEPTLRSTVRSLKARADRVHQSPDNWYRVFCTATGDSSVSFADLKSAVRRALPGLGLSPRDLPTDRLRMLWRALDSSRTGLVSRGSFIAFMRRYAVQAKVPEKDRSAQVSAARKLLADGLSNVGVESLRDALESWGAEWTGYVSEWDWQHIARQLLEYTQEQLSDDALHGVWVELDHKDEGELEAEQLLERLSMQSRLREKSPQSALAMLRPGTESTQPPSTAASARLSTPRRSSPGLFAGSPNLLATPEVGRFSDTPSERDEDFRGVASRPASFCAQAALLSPAPAEDPALRMVAERLCEALTSYLNKKGIQCSTIAGWYRFFSEIDADNSGRATFAELEDAFNRCLRSARVSRYELLMLWRRLDADGSGEVSLEEFVKLMYKYELAMWPESSDEDLARVVKVVGEGISRWHHVEGNWYKVFLLIDTQGTGTITFEDLKKFLRGTYPGLHLNREELPSEDMFGLWKAMDSTVQMKVPKSEFMTFMRRYSGQAPEKPPQVRDLAQEIAGAPELGRDQLRAVAIKIQGIVQSWLARKGYTCNSSTSPEAWAQIFKHLVDGVRLSFLGLEAAIFGAMKGRGQVSEAELMALWRILDVDRSGEVREAEFATSLYRLQTETWPRLSNNNIERLIEILNAAAQKWHRASGNWYKILTICDEEDSGRLNFDEFCKVVRKGFPGLSIGVAEISEDELRGMWRSMDSDQSGWVTVQEFMVWMRSNARNQSLTRLTNYSEAKRRLWEEMQKQEGCLPQRSAEELLTMKRILQSSLQSFWAKRGKRLKIKDGWELFWKEADEEKYGRLNFQQLEENLRALLMKHSDSLLSPRTALNSARASMVPHADETRDPVLKGITREDLRVLFAEADLDGSGEVSATEWSSMLYRLELSTWPTADEVNVPRAVATINRAAAKWYRAGDNWFKVFRLADQNSGRIDFNDFQGMVRQRTPGLGINKKKVSDQELKGLWRALDSNLSSDVRIQDFMVFMRRTEREREKKARQRKNPQLEADAAQRLIMQGLSHCSAEQLMSAYHSWGLPWTGMVSEWEWHLIVRRLLLVDEEELDDSALHAAWTSLDLTDNVAVGELLHMMRAGHRKAVDPPQDRRDLYTMDFFPDSAPKKAREELLAEATYWRSAWWTSHLRQSAGLLPKVA